MVRVGTALSKRNPELLASEIERLHASLTWQGTPASRILLLLTCFPEMSRAWSRRFPHQKQRERRTKQRRFARATKLATDGAFWKLLVNWSPVHLDSRVINDRP